MNGLYQRLYEFYTANLFDGPLRGASNVRAAILSWGEEEHPRLIERANGSAADFEKLVREDQGFGQLEFFLKTAETDVLLEAVEHVRDDLESSYDGFDHALDLIDELNAILDDPPL